LLVTSWHWTKAWANETAIESKKHAQTAGARLVTRRTQLARGRITFIMPLCFEVTINDEPPILAGLRDLKVLAAALTFVSGRDELELEVSGMLDRSDHVDWVHRDMRRGDVVTIRILDSQQNTEPVARRRTDPSIDAEQERAYYERFKRKYEPDKA
jgi:hypothetical protein